MALFLVVKSAFTQYVSHSNTAALDSDEINETVRGHIIFADVS